MSHAVRWTAKKIAQRLKLIEPLAYRRHKTIGPFRYKSLPGPDQVGAPVGPDADDSEWEVVRANSYWGAWLTDFALRGTFGVPANWDPAAPVALHLPLGEAGDFSHPEALVYVDGAPLAGCDRHHQEVRLPDSVRDGQPHALALHGWTGIGGVQSGDLSTKLYLRQCSVVQIDPPTRDLIVAARVALGIAEVLDANDPARGRLLNALDAAFTVLDTRDPLGDGFYASVGPAAEALRAGIEAAGPPLDVAVVATGHAHLDVAWLWTLGETRGKAARTFHSVLHLMEQFPEYHFTQSQPQLYEFVRQDFPALFEGIRQRVGEGRWEPIGGMWVEADCNITGAESLARQFLLGRSFFREHFGTGAESPVLWLPDVFGYAWNLPQLIRQAGLEYFMTIKIGWNQYNRLPYDSFWWQGLDGTRVLTHFSTAPDEGGYGGSTYNAMLSPAQVLGTWANFQQKEQQHTLLMAFGFGDGGGGPTREMLENARAMAAFPATPRVRQDSVTAFFRAMEQEAGETLPVWNGELYLELHRGTYTTQSRNKRANRKAEFLLHDAEFAAALAATLDPSAPYPAEAFRQAWQTVCLNQFHDIIPGSSVTPVYDESLRQYAEVTRTAESARDAALEALAGRTGGDVLIANPTSFAHGGPALWSGALEPGQRLEHGDGRQVITQPVAGGTLLDAGRLPPYSITPLAVREGSPPVPDSDLIVTPTLLENSRLRVELNAAGDITRVYDKLAAREVLAGGAIANQLQAFEDRPLDWDAWDIDIFYDDRQWLAEPAKSVEVIEQGPLRAALRIRRRILHSEVAQVLSLAAYRCHLDFDTTIVWNERHILLKAAFPVDILAPAATYEIQWGCVERPTHRNTSWDWARFETCAQKWVDLSEGGYGVSLLNDCKYGHDIHGNVMRLSLLRGPTMPDPIADMGEHHFTYSLLPHEGDWRAETIREAYALNDPLIVHTPAKPGPLASDPPPALLAVDAPNVVIETVKQAEDGRGLIVRLYEAQRRRGPVTLTAGFEVGEAWRTNLLEDDGGPLDVNGRAVMLSVRPFEIVTLRIVPAGS